MRSAIVVGLLALSSSVAGLVAQRASAPLTLNDAISIVSNLQSTILPYEQAINKTIAALPSGATSAQKDAAAASVNQNLQAILSAIKAAKNSAASGSSSKSGSSSTGSSQDLQKLTTSTTNTLTGTVRSANKSLGGSRITTAATSMDNPFSGFLCLLGIFLPYLGQNCNYWGILS